MKFIAIISLKKKKIIKIEKFDSNNVLLKINLFVVGDIGFIIGH